MRLMSSYLHIYVFAAFFIGFAAVVASDPDAFVEDVRPVVRDAVALTETAEDYLRNFSLRVVAEETVDLFVTTIRLPSRLLEQVGEDLEKVEKRSATNTGLPVGQPSEKQLDAPHA